MMLHYSLKGRLPLNRLNTQQDRRQSFGAGQSHHSQLHSLKLIIEVIIFNLFCDTSINFNVLGSWREFEMQVCIHIHVSRNKH